jgi:RNA polymerase-binding transcription factor DksA
MTMDRQDSIFENALNADLVERDSLLFSPEQLGDFRRRIEREIIGVRRELIEWERTSEKNSLVESLRGEVLTLKEKRLSAALIRLEENEFGICCQCRDEMSLAQLDAEPEAPFCEDCKEEINARRKVS